MKADDDPGQTRSIPSFEVRTNGVAPLTRAGIEGAVVEEEESALNLARASEEPLKCVKIDGKESFVSLSVSPLSLSFASFFEIFLS